MATKRASVPHQPFLLPYFEPFVLGRLELIWPLPLVVAGVFAWLNPVLISIAVMLALVPWLLRWLSSGRWTQPAGIAWPLAVWLIAGFFSTWNAYDPTLSLPGLFTLMGGMGLFFAVVNSTISAWSLARGFTAMAGVVALYFVSQYAQFNYALESGWPAYLGQLSSTFMPDLVFFIPQVNNVAGLLVGFLMLAGTITRISAGLKKWLWTGVTAVLLYGLLISGSRGAWLGLITAGIILGLLQLPWANVRWLSIAGFGATIMVAFGLLQVAPPALVAAMPESVRSRLDLYQNVWYLLPDYIFTGIGPDQTFAMVYSHYQLLIQVPFLTYAHNMFLAVGLAYGLPGIVALVWLVISFYYFVFRTEQQGSVAPVFRAGWLGITAVFVHGLFDTAQFSGVRWTLPPFFLLLGLTILAGNMPHTPLARRHTRTRYLLAVGLAGTLIAMLWFANTVLAAWYANWGAIYHTKADLSPYLTEAGQSAAREQAMQYFETARQYAPDQATANRRLGMIALERRQFDVALTRLQAAIAQEPANQATLKLLGLAYLWTGQLDQAEQQLRQLDSQSEIVEELGQWHSWWLQQGLEDLANKAQIMTSRLAAD